LAGRRLRLRCKRWEWVEGRRRRAVGHLGLRESRAESRDEYLSFNNGSTGLAKTTRRCKDDLLHR